MSWTLFIQILVLICAVGFFGALFVETWKKNPPHTDGTRCRCKAYPVSREHCLTLFDRQDIAVERHAVGGCEGNQVSDG